MKCPKCSRNHPYKEGMKCLCGYQFTLNPKQPPYFTDKTIQMVIEKLSGGGRYYFTKNQLYATLFKKRLQAIRNMRFWTGGSIGFAVWILILIYTYHVHSNKWFMTILGLSIVFFVLFFHTLRKISPRYMGDIMQAIETYHKTNPISNMTTGKAFQNTKKREIDENIFAHAPEKILIVEHDDFTDTLLLNHFYFEEKCLVLSENKYPQNIFEAYQKFITIHPGIPISILHDASQKGLAMEKRLRSQKEWMLSDKEIIDLGLKKEDAKSLQKHGGLWLYQGNYERKLSSNTEDNIKQGYRVPLDFTSPMRMKSILAGSLIAGVGFSLMAEEWEKKGATTIDRGFG